MGHPHYRDDVVYLHMEARRPTSRDGFNSNAGHAETSPCMAVQGRHYRMASPRAGEPEVNDA